MSRLVLAEFLLARADSTPEAVAYETLDSDGEVHALGYAQVAARATALARELADHEPGPVLLAGRAGSGYPIAVFAGFLAGRPVIPAFPPGLSSPDGARLAGIIADARPAAVIASDLADVDCIGVPALTVPDAAADATPWGRPRHAEGPDVAIIQYTSGSTGRPRGVLVRHDSLAANVAAIAQRFGLREDSRALTWLPPFHDMGLVGGLLTPVAAGIPVRVMAPRDFLRSPLSWLHQISASGATASGAPDFGYELCVRRVRRDDQLDGLDLSRWKVAFNGGETVRPRTLAAFAATFAPAGFRAEAFLPCYGLAEATLIVSAGRWSERPDAGAVSCGRPVTGQQVAVVDPDRLVRTEGEGEIWIAGEHISPGYLTGADPSSLFGELDGVRYLRTGDLGLLRDGELHLTGRIKDVIVHRGVKYHAVDVEACALESAARVGRAAAAFLVDTGTEPIPVLVVEVPGRPNACLADSIRAAVLAGTGLWLSHVILVRPRTIPRTSSGKVRRSACRDAYTGGLYADAVYSGESSPEVATPVTASEKLVLDTREELTSLICGIVAGVCELDEWRPDAPLVGAGVDSVRAAEAAAVLEHALALPVPLEVIVGNESPIGIAAVLVTRWGDSGIEPRAIGERIRIACAAGAA